MKRLAGVLVIFMAILMVGCSSDDGGSTNSDAIYLKWTVNGETYNIEDPETVSSLSTAISANQGMDASFRRLVLWMPNDAAVGTHQIVFNNGSETDIYSAVYYEGSDLTAESATGTIVIQSIDDEYIKGTFTFTAANFEGETYTITNGSFRAYKPEEPGN